MASRLNAARAGLELHGNVRSVPQCAQRWPLASPLSYAEPLSATKDVPPRPSPRSADQVALIFVFSIHELIPKRLFWD